MPKRHLLKECLLEISLSLTTVQVMMFTTIKSDTKVVNKVYDDTATVKKSVKRMFMSGMKKTRIKSIIAKLY